MMIQDLGQLTHLVNRNNQRSDIADWDMLVRLK